MGGAGGGGSGLPSPSLSHQTPQCLSWCKQSPPALKGRFYCKASSFFLYAFIHCTEKYYMQSVKHEMRNSWWKKMLPTIKYISVFFNFTFCTFMGQNKLHKKKLKQQWLTGAHKTHLSLPDQVQLDPLVMTPPAADHSPPPGLSHTSHPRLPLSPTEPAHHRHQKHNISNNV